MEAMKPGVQESDACLKPIAQTGVPPGACDADQTSQRRARILAAVEHLPSLPAYVFELNRLLSVSPVDLKRVSTLVAADPALAAQVPRMCHAPLWGLSQKIFNIAEACILLGAARLRTLVLTTHLLECLGQELPAGGVLAFWQHCVLTALLSQQVALATSATLPEEAYLGGLLHDIGALPIMLAAARELPDSKLPPLEGPDETLKSEQEMFGIDHCELGRAIAIYWRFPASLVAVLERHHRPEEASREAGLVRIVAAADRFSRARGYALGVTSPILHPELEMTAEGCLRACLPALDARRCRQIAEVMEEALLRFTQKEFYSVWPLAGPAGLAAATEDAQ
jgi:HD-like signal output (HDOD) protein